MEEESNVRKKIKCRLRFRENITNVKIREIEINASVIGKLNKIV